jgi:hypothetical protein
LNGLGGQGHVCEESSCQEKGVRRQEEAGQESSRGEEPLQQEVQSAVQVVEESREVSQAQ